MSKTQIVRKSFNGGEIAPDLWYRSDLEAYHSSCKSLLNMNVTPWGGAERRPPTELLAKIDTATYGVPVKYLPFKFSLTETFHVVFTDGSGSASPSASTADLIVFDSTGTLVTLTGASTKILDTVYDPGDLLSLHFIQVNDFIYMTCGGDYPVQSLSRFYDEVELGNRWVIGETQQIGGPYGEINDDSSDTFSVVFDVYDAGKTYAEGDVVHKASSVKSIISTSLDALWGAWRLRLHTSGAHGFVAGNSVFIDGVLVNGVRIDGTYSVAFVEATNHFVISRIVSTSDTVTLDLSASAYKNDGGNFGFYTSLADSNTGNALTNGTWWSYSETHAADVVIRSTVERFDSGDIGRRVRIRNEDFTTLSEKWNANDESQQISGFGEVTLTTEGGAWQGRLDLQESKDGGGKWETIGTIRSAAGVSNGSISREISNISSLVRVKLSDYVAQSGYTLNRCAWKLEFTGSVNSHFTITEVIDGFSVRATALTPLGQPFTDSRWALGVFSEKTGFPRTLGIHDERMVLGGSNEKPNTVWASRVNNWTNFLEGDLDTSPYEFTIKSDSFDSIRWIRSVRDLMVGTDNSESTMGTRDPSSTINPTNIDVKTHTYFGSSNLQAVVTADLVFFVQGQSKRVRSTQYDFGTDQYLSSEMSIYAYHMTAAGIKEMSFTRDPYSLLFFTMEDGKAVTFTYERDNAVKGWARLELGGSGSLVSAASNYTPAGDSIFGIVLRNGEYTLEGFTKTTAASVYLDGQIQFVDQDYSAGVSVPINSTGAVVVRNDALLDPADYTIAANVLTIPGATDGTVTIGWPTSFEIAPTNPIETGDFGTVRRVEDISLYLIDSGGCDITINGSETLFSDSLGLAATERLDGEYELSADGGYDSKVNVVLSGNHHRPFKIVGMGFDVSRHS